MKFDFYIGKKLGDESNYCLTINFIAKWLLELEQLEMIELQKNQFNPSCKTLRIVTPGIEKVVVVSFPFPLSLSPVVEEGTLGSNLFDFGRTMCGKFSTNKIRLSVIEFVISWQLVLASAWFCSQEFLLEMWFPLLMLSTTWSLSTEAAFLSIYKWKEKIDAER